MVWRRGRMYQGGQGRSCSYIYYSFPFWNLRGILFLATLLKADLALLSLANEQHSSLEFHSKQGWGNASICDTWVLLTCQEMPAYLQLSLQQIWKASASSELKKTFESLCRCLIRDHDWHGQSSSSLCHGLIAVHFTAFSFLHQSVV